jgi:RNA polymerase sigma factor (sigma-70 family)
VQPRPDDLAVRAANDPEAFVALYNAYFKRVYSYTFYRCGDGPTAEDLTGRVFERLLVYISRYSPQKGPFEAWLFALARNVVNDHYRRQRFPWLPWEAFRQQPDREPSPEEQSVQREAMDELKLALQRLDRRSLDLVSLKFFARLTNRQIAGIVHMSESSVGVALFRAVGRLRKWLSVEESPGLNGCREKELEDERA